MSYCINPHCPKPADPANVNNRFLSKFAVLF
ncbi:4-Cys prefix domain-containing protein [Sphaerospermopsis torques-reginae]